MTKRVLAIGVGGSGKAALTIMKERLEETYGQVPDNVVLLSLDTDDLRDLDQFAGTRLNPQYDDRTREPEFCHIVSRPGVTMDTIFADMTAGRTYPYMYWLEKEKLQRILGPAERDIRGGAQQRRPIGRVAVFQRWDTIYSSIQEAIVRVYGDPAQDEPVEQRDRERVEQSKRLVFIIGSVAGGTGSGSLIDVTNLVRHAINSNQRFQSIDVSAVVVLPDAFSQYTTMVNDLTNLKPNSYAAMRELDRFIRTHSGSLPYMVRYGENIHSVTWSTNTPVDHVYLVDTASPGALNNTDLSGDPMLGVFPVISDFIMAHVDGSLGDALATLRCNAGQHYGKEEGWQYSSFNILTYIFPVDDVIESFSYRFLREMLAFYFLPIADPKEKVKWDQQAAGEVEVVFAANSVQGKVNPTVIQKAIAATRPVQPEIPDVSWTGLFNLIALSDSAFAQDYQDLQGWMNHLDGLLTPTKEGDYRKESYDDGYSRLLSVSEHFMDECLGAQYDATNEDARAGGEWDKILGPYRDALRQRFAEALDAALLDLLNRRDPATKVLLPARLPQARSMTTQLKIRLMVFKKELVAEYAKLDVDNRIRQTSEQLRNAITWMNESRSKSFALIGKSEARKSQDSYIGLFREKMELMLHQHIYAVVMDILDTLGAEENNNSSVVEQAGLELENWQITYQEVDKLLDRWWRQHEKNREEKRKIKVRKYVTTPEFENQLYSQPLHLEMAQNRVLGQVQGNKGLEWKRVDENIPLDFKVVTVWTERANGAEEISRRFFAGVKGLFQVVREHVTIAERLAASHTSSAAFVNIANQINEPFLRYNPAVNGKTYFHERYISFNSNRAPDAQARKFLDDVQQSLRGQGVNVDASAESSVACTILEVARGVKLLAVDQFMACEPDYRNKLYRGHESLHLFPEEQVATDYEGRIQVLGEPKNQQRPLSPELVITMGDEEKLKSFILACAYGLIEVGPYLDPATNAESTEIFLRLEREDADTGERREALLLLSNSRLVRELDPRFDTVPQESQIARLYLNALQNYTLLATQKLGVPDQLVAILQDDLVRRGVNLGHIDNPFTLRLKEVNDNINRRAEAVGGPRDRAEYLQLFIINRVNRFKQNQAQRVSDMGTVMHLILRQEINRLKVLTR